MNDTRPIKKKQQFFSLIYFLKFIYINLEKIIIKKYTNQICQRIRVVRRWPAEPLLSAAWVQIPSLAFILILSLI